MAGDKNEIRKLNRIIQRPGSKEGIEAGIQEETKTPRREKSARILKQQERRRLKTSEEALSKYRNWSKSVQWNQAYGRTPKWFGRFQQGLSTRERCEAEINRCNVLPKFDISTKEILEITDDHRKSKILLQSFSEECKEMIEEEDNYKDSVTWTSFTDVKEHLVSRSPVSCIDSCGDFITYGAENGAVGLLIAGHSLNLRPHTDIVSGLVMDGSKILSSSFDGTVRIMDLAEGRVPLFYNWDLYGDDKHGVLGMARRSEHSHILDCDKRLIILDLRNKDTAAVVDILGVTSSYPYSNTRPSSVNIEPINNQGREFCVCRNDKYWIFDAQGGTPDKDRRCQFKTQVPRSLRSTSRENFSLDGSLWCPWQSSILFCLGESRNRNPSLTHLQATITSFSAIDTVRYIFKQNYVYTTICIYLMIMFYVLLAEK